MFSFLNKNSESKTLPTPEEAPADQVMQEIEAMQLDDSPGKIYCIVISDQERAAIFLYLNDLSNICESSGVDSQVVEHIRKMQGRFQEQPDDDDVFEISEDPIDKDLDPAYLFDKPASSNKW